MIGRKPHPPTKAANSPTRYLRVANANSLVLLIDQIFSHPQSHQGDQSRRSPISFEKEHHE
jgi:hypothetical protein